MDEHKEQHESYGMVGVSRVTNSGRVNLFGSSINHHSTIVLRINRAEYNRHLHSNWYHAIEHLIEVEMSNTQFAEMITNPNCGDGVPCTIRYINNLRMENPPIHDQRLMFEEEFEYDMQQVKLNIKEALDKANALLKQKTLKVSEKQEIVNLLFKINQDIESNMPFVQKQFNKAIDKTVLEAKNEVEAFISNKITSLGIEALRSQFPQVEWKEDK